MSAIKLEQDQNDRMKAARISLVMSIFILSFKFAAFFVSGSQAIFSDAAESIVNVVSAVLALVVIGKAFEPADRSHPYGHGKMEFFSAAFEGGLIACAALFIICKAAMALIEGPQVEKLGYGLLLIGVGAFLNLILGLYLRKIGQRSSSKALLASSAHVLSDLWTSLGIILGLCLYLVTGWAWIDPLIAIVVALFLAYTGFGIVRDAFKDLLDSEDKTLIERLALLVKKHRFPGMIQVHHSRILRAGIFHHIDAHLVLPQFWDIEQAHIESGLFENKIIGEYGYEGEICFHIDPCRHAYCEVCDYISCPVRVKEFICCKTFSMDEFIDPQEPAKIFPHFSGKCG